MNILTIKGGVAHNGHNSSASLLKDGKLIASVEEEKFVRKKHAGGLPIYAIDFCLRKAKISFYDVNIIGIVDVEEVIQEKYDEVMHYYFKHKNKYIDPAYKTAKRIEDLNGYFGKMRNDVMIEILPHQLMHAATAYYTSPFNEAAILVCEGAGDYETSGLYKGENGTVKKIHDFLVLPQSIGLFYESVGTHIGMPGTTGAGKTMGLAAFGTVDKELFIDFVKFSDDPKYPVQTYPMSHDLPLHVKSFEKFAPARLPHEPLEQKHYDLAASAQFIIEEAVIRMVKTSRNILPDMKNLCTAGGTMLNVNANRNIVQSGIYSNVHFTPAANDGGLTLGAAYYLQHKHMHKLPRSKFSVYLGPDIETDFDLEGIFKTYSSLIYFLPLQSVEEDAAEALSRGEIIGWMQGKMEWGPRALGNRSILANPLLHDVKQRLDTQVKVREPFRPYAASILAEEADKWFTPPFNPHMLISSKVLPEVKDKIPGLVHVDGTCRPQIVREEDNPRYHSLLQAFFRKTSCPLLLNTSFNLHGEPIVNTPEEALEDLFFSGLDAVYIGNYRVTVKRERLPGGLAMMDKPKNRKDCMVFLELLSQAWGGSRESRKPCVLRMDYGGVDNIVCEQITNLSGDTWMIWGREADAAMQALIRQYRLTFTGHLLPPKVLECNEEDPAVYAFDLLTQIKPALLVVPEAEILSVIQTMLKKYSAKHFTRKLYTCFENRTLKDLVQSPLFKEGSPCTNLISAVNDTTFDTDGVPVYPLSLASNARLAVWGAGTEFLYFVKPGVATINNNLSIVRVVDSRPDRVGKVVGGMEVMPVESLLEDEYDGIILADVPRKEAMLRASLLHIEKPLYFLRYPEYLMATVDNAAGKTLAVWGCADVFETIVEPYLCASGLCVKVAYFMNESVEKKRHFSNLTVRPVTDLLSNPVDGVLLTMGKRRYAMRRLQALGLTLPVYWCPKG